MKKLLMAVLIGFALALSGGSPSFAGDKDKPAFDKDTFKAGRKVFKRKQCSGCHALDTDEKGEKGPGLKGVYAKRGKAWITKWLKDPVGIAKTDPDMKKGLETWPDGMENPELSDEQLEQVLLYIAYEGKKP